MGFFNWSAPVFHRFADRWSPDRLEEIAGWLEPYVPRGGHVVDVGGGTGALALKLSRALQVKATVLDPTPEMLAYVPRDEPLLGAVLGSAEEMPFDTSSVDAVIVSDAFHHFRDQSAAAREMARVVRRGGGIIVVELDPSGPIMRMVVLGERLLGEPGAFFTPEAMCAFWHGHGVSGKCTRMGGPGYRFVGTVD